MSKLVIYFNQIEKEENQTCIIITFQIVTQSYFEYIYIFSIYYRYFLCNYIGFLLLRAAKLKSNDKF